MKAGLDVDDVKSYRLIFNLAFISKVIECVIAEQLKSFLIESDLMPPKKLSCQPRYSTEAATLKAFSDILDAVDMQEITLLDQLNMSCSLGHGRSRDPVVAS
jgi:hypothetical protein